MGPTENYPVGHPLRIGLRLYGVDDIVERMIRHAQSGGYALRLLPWLKARIRTKDFLERGFYKHAPWHEGPPARS